MAQPPKPSGVAVMAASFVSGLILSIIFISQFHRQSMFMVPNNEEPSSSSTDSSVTVNTTTSTAVAGTHSAMESGEANESVSLFVLIYSQKEEGAAKVRKALRSTWIADLASNQAYRFVIPVGASVDRSVTLPGHLVEEQQENEDMLFISEDPTLFVSSRQLLVGLEWLMGRQFDLLLKVNHASFVDINKLTEAVGKMKSKYLLWGYFRGNEQVKRSGPHSEREWSLCETFLPFPEGGGYIVSRDIVEMITTLGPYLQHMDNDDGAMGVWTAPYDHIKRQHDTRFNTGLKSRGCSNKYFITHPETAETIAAKHKLLTSEKKLCEKEEQIVPGYEYKWDVPMKDCCKESKSIP